MFGYPSGGGGGGAMAPPPGPGGRRLAEHFSQVQLRDGKGQGENGGFMYDLPDDAEDMAADGSGDGMQCGSDGGAQGGGGGGLFGTGGGNTFMPPIESQGCGGAGAGDYATPADAAGAYGMYSTQDNQYCTQEGDKENYCTQEGAGIQAQTPGSMPPVGKMLKRRRPAWHNNSGVGGSQVSHGYGSQFNGSYMSNPWDSCTEQSTQETGNTRMEAPGGLFGTQGEATSGPAAGSQGMPYVIAAPRVGLSRSRKPGVKNALSSPGIARNPFLADEDAGKSNSSRPLPRLKPMPSRYRSDFREEGELGKGAYSKVFKCRRRLDGCLYAVKCSRQPLHNDGDRRHAVGEVQALAAMGSHPNLVQYFGAFEENAHLYIQLELCAGGALDSAREAGTRLTERTLIAIVANISAALAHMHSKGVAHMDVKPDNIYCTGDLHAPEECSFKLGDLGSATHLDGTHGFKEGDCRYMPAEILNDDFSALDKADVWSLGATVYELARPPPDGESTVAPLPREGPQFAAIRAGKLTLLPGLTSSFQALLKRMMERDSAKRPTAAEAASTAMKLLAQAD